MGMNEANGNKIQYFVKRVLKKVHTCLDGWTLLLEYDAAFLCLLYYISHNHEIIVESVTG